MYRKLVFLASFVLVLSIAGNVSAELIAHWTFDEGSGTIAYDYSGNGNNGTLQGNPQWVAGRIGGALQFDGSGDYVDCGNDAIFDITEEVTLSVWVKTNDAGNSQNNMWLGKGDHTYAIKHQTGNNVEFFIYDGGWHVAWYAVDSSFNDDWHHVAGTYDGSELKLYIDGELEATTPHAGSIETRTHIVYMGENSEESGRFYDGVLDDARIYNEALTQEQIQVIMQGEGYPYASGSVPPDGELYTYTYVILSWRSGDFAVSHDVYFGDNFDDVNDGVGDTFYGNQTANEFIVGFQDFPYPEGLVPGTTYYWRIDEVNDADPNSPWKGDIWSFWIPPIKAYEPNPADGTMFVDPNVILTWTPGFNAGLHTVYFGDDFDTVNNATDGTRGGLISYNPGPLEYDKTYYWRVDEYDGFFTHKGDVWSFTTTLPGLGTIVQEKWNNITGNDLDTLKDYWKYPNNPDETKTLNRFDTGTNLDNDYGGKVHGWLYVPATGDYTFWLCTDDNGELWLSTDDDPSNIRLIASESSYSSPNTWGAGEEQSEPIPLVGGNKYYIMALWKEGGGGDHCQVAWQGPGVPTRIIIPGSNLSPYEPLNAYGAKPANNATGVTQTPILQWKPGLQAASHEVYFGTDKDAVENATKTSPQYKGTRALGDESFNPGKLAWESTYYWRIDEVNNINPDSPWIGSVWSFTTAEFLILDDFEDYDANDNQIWYAWRDGLGFGAIGVPPYSPGNGTGSAVGDETTPSYMEESIVNSGRQSMPYWYNNNKPDKAKYSEAKLTMTTARDWTEGGVRSLSLWFQGYPASVGSFTEGPTGTYTMTASGFDIWTNAYNVEADEFHFAYKTLNGQGSIIAKVESVQNTNGWAKAGVMIRETLDPNSAHAFACITPDNGVAFQGRPETGAAGFSTNQTGITAPHWVKLERDIAGNFTVSHSADGSTWEAVQGALPETIPMNANVFIGLAVTAHNAAATCEAVFSNVTISDNAGTQWMHQDIGIQSNDPEPMYVAVANRTGTPAVVYHDDPNAAQIDTWTEWNIDLKDFADQGVILSDVNSIAIGFGDRNNPQAGSGKMYFDDIRLYRPRYIPGKGTPLAADFDSDGIVYNSDLEIMSDNWLDAAAAPSGSPVGWWKFEGNLLDSSGNNNHGDPCGAPSYVSGQVGSALEFDGIDDGVSTNKSLLNDLSEFTLAGWVSAGNPDVSRIGLFGQNDCIEFGFDGAITVWTISGSQWVGADWTFENFTWHHAAVTGDGTSLTIYLDGQLAATGGTATTNYGNSTYGFNIGGGGIWDASGNWFSGQIDEVRVYNYALSSSEIFYLAGSSPLDLNDDMKIDFKDYALLVDQWLDEQLWPEW